MRVAGIVPDIGLTDSHPSGKLKYRTAALKVVFGPDVKTVTVWTTGTVEPASAPMLTCPGDRVTWPKTLTVKTTDENAIR